MYSAACLTVEPVVLQAEPGGERVQLLESQYKTPVGKGVSSVARPSQNTVALPLSERHCMLLGRGAEGQAAAH